MNIFQWPQGKSAALSLSFDDARASQLDNGVPLLESLGVRASFYVSPPTMQERVSEWRAVAQRHEIGNHTLTHPCSGNFVWSRHKALEDYTLEKMEGELAAASEVIKNALGVDAETFAYPCGQIFVGRGEAHRSYVPLVAKHFIAGRGYLSEAPNDPTFCDLAGLNAAGFDLASFEDLKPQLDHALQSGGWVILAGHDIGKDFGRQTVSMATLEGVCRFAHEAGFWLDTVASVAKHIVQQRQTNSMPN